MTDSSTAEQRTERAARARREADAVGIDTFCLIGRKGSTVEEHPDVFYGWANVEPGLGEDAVAEFRRADFVVSLLPYP